MIHLAAVSNIDPGSILNNAQGFLNYGPLGLAGLLIALVLTAVLLRNVDPARERVLKLVLFVGAFCFIAALVAQYLTPPLSPRPAPDYSAQRATLSDVVGALKDAGQPLQEVIDMASAAGCPGGAHGIAIPHGADMASRSAQVKSTLGTAADEINQVIRSLPGGATGAASNGQT
jgi:hypothetical protein